MANKYYTGQSNQYGEQQAFNQYLNDMYFQNPYTGQAFMPQNVVDPINTFEANQDLQDRLKKQRQTISPIRQYDNNTLQYDITTGTGKYDFNPYFKAFNTAAFGVTSIANEITEAKNRRDEYNQYLKSLLPRPQFNPYEDGLNNIPVYKTGGKKKSEPSPEKARKILEDGTVYGKKITDKQRRFFGAIASKMQDGGPNPYLFTTEDFVGLNDWHHNVDNIPFPGETSQLLDYSFTPVQVNYNQKYVPYRSGIIPQPVTYTQIQEPVQPIQQFPQTLPITQQSVQTKPIQKPNPYTKPKGTGTVADWFKNGGATIGQEIEIDKDTLLELQKQGYKFEII